MNEVWDFIRINLVFLFRLTNNNKSDGVFKIVHSFRVEDNELQQCSWYMIEWYVSINIWFDWGSCFQNTRWSIFCAFKTIDSHFKEHPNPESGIFNSENLSKSLFWIKFGQILTKNRRSSLQDWHCRLFYKLCWYKKKNWPCILLNFSILWNYTYLY